MRVIGLALMGIALLATAPASAMDRNYGSVISGNRAPIVDPDEHLERMAAAGTTGDKSNAKPRKSARGVLKDDPYLSEAFRWLDNK